ncbi:phosphatase PAP2 family protein [Rummeliibacillus stabekisii]|uniref:Phosphoesterase PA-phosphatase n=1 Tax=Rummeliibacillus stabekisii TaxID=241244 RepID=A0A143HFT4_9BACL|nr:phosphatase PAP2 family protein [Rummeliibacillus stabekisii]AMX00337.1 phosphoesterase PA-phosphatase [Rummeliibacillus stabekisii]
MKLKGHLLSAILIGLVSLIGFSCMAILISAQKIVRFDQTLISFIRGFESHTLTSIMKFFTFIGSFPVVLVLFLIASYILYCVLRCRAEVFLLGTVILGTQVINQVLKIFFHRARPDFHLLIDVGGYSFPSGHAMSAFAFYGILTFIFWRHIPNRFGRTTIVLFSSILILIIGTSRIYLGVHYPSDIIGGYFVSSIWLTIVIWFFQRYKEKQYEKNEVSE